jgi:hypothetical protein
VRLSIASDEETKPPFNKRTTAGLLSGSGAGGSVVKPLRQPYFPQGGDRGGRGEVHTDQSPEGSCEPATKDEVACSFVALLTEVADGGCLVPGKLGCYV